jgi:hypothetical protein
MKKKTLLEQETLIVLFVAKCPSMPVYRNLSSGLKMVYVYMTPMSIICCLISIRGNVIVEIGEIG